MNDNFITPELIELIRKTKQDNRVKSFCETMNKNFPNGLTDEQKERAIKGLKFMIDNGMI